MVLTNVVNILSVANNDLSGRSIRLSIFGIVVMVSWPLTAIFICLIPGVGHVFELKEIYFVIFLIASIVAIVILFHRIIYRHYTDDKMQEIITGRKNTLSVFWAKVFLGIIWLGVSLYLFTSLLVLLVVSNPSV